MNIIIKRNLLCAIFVQNGHVMIVYVIVQDYILLITITMVKDILFAMNAMLNIYLCN